MPTSSRRASSLLQLAAVAALIVVVRLPFLLHADRFFDSDEAVEGLMARHLLHGELPVFLWGQHYKGVPEVYLSGAIFSIAGSSVVALKSATLACFVVFVCLQFVLIRTLFSPRIAWMTTALLAFGPPSLVLWSLSANAEIVMTLLAGAVMGLALVRWQGSQSRAAIAVAAAALGFGLWVQQYIVYYVAALATSVLQAMPARWAVLRTIVAGNGFPRWFRACMYGVLTIAAAYVTLGVLVFATGGFDVTVGGVFIGLNSPQKLWRIGAAMAALYCGLEIVARVVKPGGSAWRPVAIAALAGFTAGYAPALAASFQGGQTASVPRMDLHDLRSVAPSFATDLVPIVVGFRSPTTEWLSVSPWLSVLFAVLIAVSYRAAWTRGVTPFFHALPVAVLVLFVASGSFVDAQSYRYLMPMYAALPVVFALGIDEIGRWSRPLAALAFCGLVGVFAVEQRDWYRRLAPDTRSPAVIACLRQQGVRGAFADYWLSYKVTFLADEQPIVAPEGRFDRYPPYSAFVRSLGPSPTAEPCRPLLLQ